MNKNIIILVVCSLLLVNLASAGLFGGSKVIMINKESAATGVNWTTDQNDELNTTGSPTFFHQYLTGQLYIDSHINMDSNHQLIWGVSGNNDYGYAKANGYLVTLYSNWYQDFLTNGWAQLDLDAENRRLRFTSGGNGPTPTFCIDSSCVTGAQLTTDDDNPESNEVHWSDLTDDGTFTNTKYCTYDSGNNRINCDSEGGSETGTSLWWNQSNVATYNGSIKVDGSINVTDNYQSLTDVFGAGHELIITGESNVATAYGSCLYEGNPTLEFICNAPYNQYDKQGKLNITGRSNVAVMKLGHPTTIGKETVITGNANLVGGTNEVDSSYVDGSANLVWGTGDFNVTSDSKGNINIGNNNVMETSVGGGAFGQLHYISGNYCYAFGAQNTCAAPYGTALGYANKVTGGTSVAIGRGNEVSSLLSGILGYYNYNSAQQTYVFGRRVNETRNFHVTLGNGEIGDLNRDLVINKTHIILNKDTIHNNITSTGSNAGTQVCIDANNQLCPCGSCA